VVNKNTLGKKANQNMTYALIAFVLLVAGLGYGVYSGQIVIPAFSLNGGGTSNPPTVTDPGYKTPCSYPTAKVTTDITAWDSLDITTARTINTNIGATWWRNVNGQWLQVGSGNAADLSINTADADKVYLCLAGLTGQAFYVDVNKILQMNPHLKFYAYQDITGDSVKDYIFQASIAGSTFASATGKWLMPSTAVYLVTYDSSFSIPAGGQPADVTGIGTTAKTTYLHWYAAASAEKKGIAIYQVKLVANTSDTSAIQLLKVNIPGVGYIDGSNFSLDVQATQQVWTYTITSQSLYGADMLNCPINDPNQFQFTTAVSTTMSAGNHITLAITLSELSVPSAGVVTDSDTVSLEA
jgi:hypothetical protein